MLPKRPNTQANGRTSGLTLFLVFLVLVYIFVAPRWFLVHQRLFVNSFLMVVLL